jgi:hypothetical protein
MRAVFDTPVMTLGAVRDNIINIDISMYDEVMLSSLSIPHFKVTFPYSFGFGLGSAGLSSVNSFDNWWGYIKTLPQQWIKEIEVSLIDNHGTTIADGKIIEYTENRESFELEIVCVRDIGLELTVSANVSRNQNRDIRLSNNITGATFHPLFLDWFNDMWSIVMGGGFRYELSSSRLIRDLASVLCMSIISSSDSIATGNYFFKFEYRFNGTRRTFLSYLAQILRAKIVYDFANEIFRIFPFSEYEDDPVVVTGYVISESWDHAEQHLDNFTHFTLINAFNNNGQKLGEWQNGLNSFIKNRLSDFVYFRQFEIWGYANQMLFSGQSIRLTGIDYYIKDISYEYETLNDMKTFKATCIRFDETATSGDL